MLKLSTYIVLFGIFGLALAPPSNAETWARVDDDAKTGRVLIDVDSINRYTYKDDAAHSYVQAHIKVLGADTTPRDWSAMVIIDFDSCMAHENGSMRMKADGDKNTLEFFWDKSGEKLYDSVGMWMCGFSKEIMKQIEEEKSKQPPENKEIPVPKSSDKKDMSF